MGEKEKKQRFEIFNSYGERIFLMYVEDKALGLSGQKLDMMSLPLATLHSINFSKADIYQPNFEGADLKGCSFCGAVLRGASFIDAKLIGVDFSGANFEVDAFGNHGSLEGADASSSNFHLTRLAGVKYNSKTLFPEDFIPSQNGMVLIDE